MSRTMPAKSPRRNPKIRKKQQKKRKKPPLMATRKAAAAAVKPAPKQPARKTAPPKPGAKKSNRYLRADQIYSRLEAAYPDAKCALDHSNPLQLLVATILSAQSTDKMVNAISPALFKKYRTAKDFANADTAELETMIHSTGFFRNKAKNLKAAARMVDEQYGGKVPDTMEELLNLPGVARKTANVVLGVAYEKAEGVVV